MNKGFGKDDLRFLVLGLKHLDFWDWE